MFESNGTVDRLEPKRRSKARSANVPVIKPWHSVANLRTGITVGMGCGIPLLCLSLSNLGGSALCDGGVWLGCSFLGLCSAVLGVSLSHLAAAVEDITRSSRWQAWCLAVSIDASLVCCELASVCGHNSWIRSGVMVAVTVASMALNCWAFLRHK